MYASHYGAGGELLRPGSLEEMEKLPDAFSFFFFFLLFFLLFSETVCEAVICLPFGVCV
jgi:hypothetical protein